MIDQAFCSVVNIIGICYDALHTLQETVCNFCSLFVEQGQCTSVHSISTTAILQCGWSMQKWRWG